MRDFHVVRDIVNIEHFVPLHMHFFKNRVIYLLFRFFRAYFLRLGFLDGWQGYYIARLSAFSTLTRYTLVREAQETSAAPGDRQGTNRSSR